jgi:hypothetical protein
MAFSTKASAARRCSGSKSGLIPSWPGLSGPSTLVFIMAKKVVDAWVKPGMTMW